VRSSNERSGDSVSCKSKTTYWEEKIARRKARKVAQLNGHAMRAYKCDKCPGWHITSWTKDGQSLKILPWRRINHKLFKAKFNGGEFEIWKDLATLFWWAFVPGVEGDVGPFEGGLGECKQWCDALTFLPEDRWQAEAKRVSS
jgi:hypothetical protein